MQRLFMWAHAVLIIATVVMVSISRKITNRISREIQLEGHHSTLMLSDEINEKHELVKWASWSYLFFILPVLYCTSSGRLRRGTPFSYDLLWTDHDYYATASPRRMKMKAFWVHIWRYLGLSRRKLVNEGTNPMVWFSNQTPLPPFLIVICWTTQR